MTANKEELNPLLHTKLFLPKLRHDLIQRPRLVKLLQTGLLEDSTFTRKLTLISAPAGYGKTTLASQWLSESELPVAWLTLEASENDPNRFLTYLVASLQTISSELGSSVLGMLQAPQRPPQEIILTALLNELGIADVPMFVLLDDYHVIQSTPIHEALNFILEHLPTNTHLVITSREDPPLPLHRLQARRQMLGLRQAELSFAVDEAMAYFQSISDLQLSRDQAEKLTRRTEGWVTGLQLAALSMRAAQDKDGFIDSFTGSNRYVLDYLFEEVFEGQSNEFKDFLLQTAVLNRISAELANRLTGRTNGQALLEHLENANFFIVALDQSRQWYRYHRLFVDLLRHRLSRSPFNQKELHEHASRWYGENGFYDEAIEHAIAGEHWMLAGGYINQASDERLRMGEVTTLLRWCRQLPEEILLSRPDWGLAYAWPLILIGETQEADRILRNLKGMQPPPERGLLGQIAAAEAFLSRSTGDLQRTIELSKQALAMLPAEDRASRGNISVNLGLITWHLGQLEEAESALREALVNTKASGNQYAHHTALVFMARSYGARGDLNRAVDYLETAMKLGERMPTAVLAFCDMAEISCIRDQLGDAQDYLDRAQSIASAINNQEFQAACAVQHALFHLGTGNADAAGSVIGPALAFSRSGNVPPHTLARIQSCQVQIALAQGDINRAREIHESILMPHDAGTFTRFIDLNAPRILLASGESYAAIEKLQRAYERAERAGWGFALQIIRILNALACDEQDASIRYLEQALEQGESQGTIRTFLNEGEAIIPLLQEVARRGTKPEYIGQILAAAGGIKLQPEPSGGSYEPLSDRELEVLRLVAAGLSNRQIAEQLVVSLGTAKSHVHHIFGKLGAANRMEAVTRAHELGLL